MILDHNAASHTELRRLCARAAAMNMPQLPLLQAAASGVIGLLLLRSPAMAWPSAVMRKCSAPMVVLIGDDPDVDQGQSRGPDGWPCVRQIRFWRPSAVMVHGAGALPEHYRLAVKAALNRRKVVLVECSSASASAWVQALRCPETCLIIPRDSAHPVSTRGTVH